MSKLASNLLLLISCAFAGQTFANVCPADQQFTHSFDSGASWNFCVSLNDNHALELQDIHYHAPGDSSRQVLNNLHLAQALVHYHDKESPEPLIGENHLGLDSLQTLNDVTCPGQLYSTANHSNKLCSYVRNTGLMAKYNLRDGLQGSEYRLFSVSEYNGLTLQIQVALSEDGRIAPSVILSGASHPITTDTLYGNALIDPVGQDTIVGTRATLLYTWRMAFALNNDEPDDSVEEFNFMLEPALGSRRPMQVTELITEAFRNKERDLFRGWRVKDITGGGYYLDPQNSGYGYTDNKHNWAQFDLALTSHQACEQHSRIDAATLSTDSLANLGDECVGSLDDFVNGESLQGQHPVLWYSLSRVYRPKAEHYPIISSMQVDFEIIPFDWTATSPFEVTQ